MNIKEAAERILNPPYACGSNASWRDSLELARYVQAELDETPIDREFLASIGFVEWPSDMGPNYAHHYVHGNLNIWEFNDTGAWLINGADHLKVTTRGQVRKLLSALGKGEA